MTDDNPSHDTYTIRLTKRNGDIFDILVSADDKDQTDKRWSAMIGRNGRVYAHRTENKQKVYLGPLILFRKLGRKLLPGEKCIHINGNSLDYTRDNLDSNKEISKRRDLQSNKKES
jgi:hypothetical protein